MIVHPDARKHYLGMLTGVELVQISYLLPSENSS